MEIEVEVYKVSLVCEKRRTPLTLRVAKQFRVDHNIRPRHAETNKPGDPVIAKIPGHVLGYDHIWLLLVSTENGLEWHAPAWFIPSVTKTIIERGGWVDDPTKVPTIIL